MKNIQILLVLFTILNAQTTTEGFPASMLQNTTNQISTINMPEFDIDAMLLEDSQSDPGTPFRYGKIFSVDYNLNNSGTWEILDNGDKLWRLKINSKYAFSIGIEYDYFHLPEGAEFYVYNSNQENIFGAYSHLNNQEDYLFATPLVKGDEIILEYYEPYNVDFEGEIYLSEIIHDYRDIMNFFEDEGNNNTRICATNTHGGGELCPEAEPYELVINAVSWLDMGGFICSGSMLNNTSYDLTRYYMTAWHCTNGDNPSTFRFYFNYGANNCNSDFGNYGFGLYGSQQLATSNGFDSDWTLLRITHANIPDDLWDSWEIFYAGWNRSPENGPIVSCAVHHPGGSPKRINFDNDAAYSAAWNQGDPGTHWRVFWDNGGTEGGSSGCPLYDENFRFIGQLTGGPNVPCGDNGSYDLYGKFDRAWEDVKQWLDPGDTGAMFIDGTYDGTLIVEGCTDPNAENYNSDANIDDGSCFYGLADVFFGNTSYESIDITIENTAGIAQFEFTITDELDLITLSGASGGIAEDSGFTVSTSEDGTVIGVSLSGDGVIPIGEGTLTNLYFTYEESGTTEMCITNQVFYDVHGNELLTFGDICTPLVLDTELNIDYTNQELQFGINNIYPNPFNPIINFDVQLSQTEQVDIVIYDILGNKISNIYSGILKQGGHSFYWNAHNQSTGLYIIKCKNKNSISSQKILLMK